MSGKPHQSFENSVVVDRGKWVWQEDQNGLVFEREGRSSTSRRKARPWAVPVTTPQSAHKAVDKDRRVTLEDVKAVAVGMISVRLLQKMHQSTAELFDECYRTEQMNMFLWEILLYFDAFLEHDRTKNDDNLSIPGELGRGAREALKRSQQRLEQAKVNLGQAYSFFILGMGNSKCHHTQQGRLKVSRTLTDRDLYEVVYEFAMYITWITFGYDHWHLIHKELGRLFRTSPFNRDIRESGRAECVEVEGLGWISNKSDEYLSYRVYFDRPPVGSLNQTHSPALVNYLPSPKERHTWAFEPPYRPTKADQQRPLPRVDSYPEQLGIIGELMSKLNSETLKYIETSDSDSGSEEEEEEEEEEGEEEEGEENINESVVSGIEEDEGSDDTET